MEKIVGFRDRFDFLSNFSASEVVWAGCTAPTVEHAFQGAKSDDPEERTWVLAAPTPAAAKKRGRKVRLRGDWASVRLPIMEELLRLKFAPGSDLATRLIATGTAELTEGNTWNDRFWGVCRGVGENHLGRLLMKIREELRVGTFPTRSAQDGLCKPRNGVATPPERALAK